MKILYIAPNPALRAANSQYAASFTELLRTRLHASVTRLDPKTQENCYLDSPAEIFAIYQEVRQWEKNGFLDQFDLIQSELGWFTNREFFYLFFIKFLCPGIKVAATFHDPPVLTSELFKMGFLKSKLSKLRLIERVVDKTIGKVLEFILVKKLDLVFVLTHQGRRILSRRFPQFKDKIKYLPHCTYLPEEALRRGIHKFPQQECLILFFGYLAPEKNLALLIQAFQATEEKLKKLSPARSAILRICGGGSPYASADKFHRYLSSLKNVARKLVLEKKIDFPGYIPPAAVSRIFTSASFLVLPYGPKLEGRFSGPLLLAMSEGIPVIAPRSESFQEYIKEGETGFLFTIGNKEELSQKMFRLITDHELAERLGRAAKKLILSKNGWKRVGTVLKVEYNRLLEK